MPRSPFRRSIAITPCRRQAISSMPRANPERARCSCRASPLTARLMPRSNRLWPNAACRADRLRGYRRAALDATRDADITLREALGAKKLKELRRQRHRLEDTGALSVCVATTPQDVATALEEFLALETKSWKGARGTALIQHEGDATFIRSAAPALAAEGRFEIVSLVRNGTTIAAGLILRDGDRAYFFKIAMDESEARTSPGLQLTLDITRHLCADPAHRLCRFIDR